MNPDPMTAGKAALEERDRVKTLAAEARAILNKCEDWEEWSHDDVVRFLMAPHRFSWAEASDALAHIEWEDNRVDGESDP